MYARPTPVLPEVGSICVQRKNGQGGRGSGGDEGVCVGGFEVFRGLGGAGGVFEEGSDGSTHHNSARLSRHHSR